MKENYYYRKSEGGPLTKKGSSARDNMPSSSSRGGSHGVSSSSQHHHRQQQHKQQHAISGGVRSSSLSSSSPSLSHPTLKQQQQQQQRHKNHRVERQSSLLREDSLRPPCSQTIALFGASGTTGRHLLNLALDAGYRVQCLPADDNAAPRNAKDETTASHDSWKALQAGLEDPKQLRRVLRGAEYVIVMLNDVLPTKKEYPAGFLTALFGRLYPLMRLESSIRVVLHQSTSLAADVRGQTPVLSKVLKTVAHRRNLFLQDQDAVIRKIALEHGLRPPDENADENKQVPHFGFVVTRPTVLLQDAPSSKKLSASKSQPGPFPVSHVDLAEFTLNALLTDKLYNTSPYVVADSF